MKRMIILAALLFCLSGCQTPATVLPSSHPVLTEPPSSQPVLTEPPSSQPVLTEQNESTTEPATEPAEQNPEAEAAKGMYLLVNDTRIAVGMNYAEVSAALGPQTGPDQALNACDGSCFGTIHYHPGMTVTETDSGVIRGIELSVQFGGETDAALLGQVGLGTTMEAVLAALGEPENAATAEDDRVLTYGEDGLEILICFFDPENPNAVSGISMTQPAE